MAKIRDCKLEFVRADDYVEYFIFPQIGSQEKEEEKEKVDDATAASSDTVNNNKRKKLEMFLMQCYNVADRLINERQYIWHKDEFHLQIRTGESNEKLLNEEYTNPTKGEPELPPHLYGVTHYGDNINDEWFIVFLLMQITKEVSGSMARVIDSDGEFLLIEAADVLPNWADPDTCEQRVYIYEGFLQLVQNSPSNTSKIIPVATAISKIHANPTLYRVSKEIQNLITRRLKEFSDFDPKTAFHNQIVKLPVAAAVLLQERPTLIASVVRAFCERDVIDMKACRSMRFFPPEQPRVRTSVRFTRCLYAMLMSSNYIPERKTGWNLTNSKDSEEYKEELLGIKIACGLEILASTKAKEMPDGDDDNAENDSLNKEPMWRNYLKSLKEKGYFRGNLEGSKDYTLLLEEAKAYFKANNEGVRTTSTVGKEILQLLKNIDCNNYHDRFNETNLKPSESDDWMNISPEQLDALLTERYGASNLYKNESDINPEEFAKNLADFLDKESGLNGIGDSTDSATDDEDSDADAQNATGSSGKRPNLAKRKEEFKARVKKSNSMRKACKRNSLIRDTSATNITKADGSGDSLPPNNDGNRESHNQQKSKQPNSSKGSKNNSQNIDESSSTNVRDFLEFNIPEDNWNSNSEMSDYEHEIDLERNIDNFKLDMDIQAYMKKMDEELARTTIGHTFDDDGHISKAKRTGTKAQKSDSDDDDDDFDDIESFQPININVATLKNMMDSYKSQLGGSGPVTHLLNAMGIGMSAAAAMPATSKTTTPTSQAAAAANEIRTPAMHDDDDVHIDDLKESTV